MNNDIIEYSVPQRILFGNGAIERIPDETLHFLAKKVLLISSRQSVIKKVSNMLTDKGIEVLCFDSFDGEPKIEVLNDCLNFAVGFNPDICIGIGGGSVLDVAKVVAWAIGNNCYKFNDINITNLKSPALPMIMIPTTSGTGSEATPNAIFLDDDNNKIGIISRHIIPSVALVDPELTLTLPLKITVLTGIDAISHCLESYLSKNGSLWSDNVALKGVICGVESLPKVIRNLYDKQLRADMAYASLCGGIALSNAGTCGVHALAYPLAKYGLSHSLGISLMYPAVISFFIEAKADKFKKLCEEAGINEEQVNKYLIEPVLDALQTINGPVSLKDAGISHFDIQSMVKDASKQDRLLKNNPIDLDLNDIEKIYSKALIGII